MNYTEELLDDGVMLRKLALSNQWAKELLVKHHPRHGYEGSEIDVPAPLRFAHALMSESGKLDDFISLVGMPIQNLVGELYSWTCMDTHSDGADGTQDFIRFLAVMSDIQPPTLEILEAKADEDMDRLPSYPVDLGDTSSYPSLRAGVLAATVVSINKHFSLDWEQLRQLQDAVYLLGMCCVMGGLNRLEDVLDAIQNSGMWNISASRAAPPTNKAVH